MIDLTTVRRVLTDAQGIIDELDGLPLDETDAVTSQSKGQVRRVKAQRSQELQLLATRLELGAALVRNEYWFARGEDDPINPNREED